VTRPRGRWLRKFLHALARSGNVTDAALRARVSRKVVYERRHRHPSFARLWDEALDIACDFLELEARRRAFEGVDEPVVYKGKLCGQWVDADGQPVAEGTPGARLIPLTVKRYSDQVLLRLLEAHRPEKYGRSVKHDHQHRHDHEHRHGGTVRLSYDELRKLPLDELVRIHRETLGPPGTN
jgi:hypothetical protein